MKVSMLFAGDLVPTERNKKEFINADVGMLFGEDLLELWHESDFRCFNMETPLLDKPTPIKKNGACISADRDTISGIEKLNPSLITLANNHILDHGEEGLNSTISLLRSKKINYIGVGKTIEDARRPYVTAIKGITIGIYTCVEHEFSEATEHTAGANVYDPLNVFDDIESLRRKCDIVITLFHGGKEHYRYPSPELQKICRKFVEKGSSLVFCQHSHCIGCEEKYKGATIVYGQGNFLFDRGDSEYRKTSVLIQSEIDVNTKSIQIRYIPLVKNNQYVRIANKEKSDNILAQFNSRSHEITNAGFVEKNFSQFSRERYTEYVAALLGRNRLFAVLNRVTKGKFMESYYSSSGLLRIYNYIKCEAHREVLLETIRENIERGKKF